MLAPPLRAPSPRMLGDGRPGAPDAPARRAPTRWSSRACRPRRAWTSRSTPAGSPACRWWSPATGPSARRSASARGEEPTCASSGTSTTRELAELRAGAAIALAPSRSAETFGLAAAEAMAAGLPVAASRVGALPELVEPEALVPPGDAGALAQAIARLAGDRAAGERGRERVRALCAPGGRGAARWPASTTGAAPPRVSCGRARRSQRPDHGHHRPGRLVPGGAAAGEGLQRHRHGPRRAPSGSLGCSEHLRGEVELRARRSARAGRRCARRSSACAHARSTTWRRPRSCPPRGGGRARRCAAIARLDARRSSRRCAQAAASSTRARACSCPPPARCSARRRESPQRESTPCRPTNPYAIAKLAAHQLVGALRDHDGLHASSGIVFNHESERRPEQFVTRRITRARGRDRAGARARADARLAGCGARLVVRGGHHARRVADAPAGSRPTTTCWPAAWGTRWRNWSRRPSRAWAWTPSATCAWTPRSCARPSARRASAIPARRASVWAGSAQVGFEELVERMVRADMRSLAARSRR